MISEAMQQARTKYTQQLEGLSQESKRIHLEICELNKQKNRTVAISLLPAEVLGLVFGAYVADHWSNYTERKGYSERQPRTPYAWFRPILHVCHDWRHAAFLTHGLWTCIVPTRRSCVQFMLKHTGHLPLEIRFSCSAEESTGMRTSSAFRLAIRELTRVRAAQLDVTNSVVRQLAAIEESEPGARTLMIEDLSVDMYATREPSNSIPLFSKAEMPRLVSLETRWGDTDLLNSLCRPSLTSLTFIPGDMVSVGDLTSILERLPLLRNLHVYLGIEGYAPEVARFFELLTFPRDASIHLCLDRNDTEASYRAAVTSITAKMQTISAAAATGVFQPRSIAINTYSMDIRLWAAVQTWKEEGIPDVPLPRFCLRISDEGLSNARSLGHEMVADLASHLLEPWDLSEVVTIRFNSDFPAAQWIGLLQLQSLSKVEGIWLCRGAVRSFLGALAKPLAVSVQTPDSSAKRVLFPNLAAVSIVSEYMHHLPDDPIEVDPVVRLMRLLNRRASMVRKFDAITLIACVNVHDDDILAFSHLSLRPCEAFRSVVDDPLPPYPYSEDSDTEDESDDD
ncbi:hypothetical protein NM688_g2622 [Phlebia brevispora]|uniref:Uncharacterized protein n=1 Tax=Phlebia brevispora TaxID=194682 RepID=A0ACC1T867_9APHY|nr:hypothetical protein NM688_g2622 [Phlebia brevispora]